MKGGGSAYETKASILWERAVREFRWGRVQAGSAFVNDGLMNLESAEEDLDKGLLEE